MRRARGPDEPRLEVEDPGEPRLDAEAPSAGAPPPDDVGPGEDQDLEGPELGWTPQEVEDTLMGLWNFQVLWYGIDYAAEPGELAPVAERLTPVFETHIPREMRGVVGNIAGAGLIAGTGVAMWQREKRVRARANPQGPIARLVKRSKEPAVQAEPGQAAAQPAPVGPASSPPPPASSDGSEEPRGFAFSREETLAIANHQGGPVDSPLETMGLA